MKKLNVRSINSLNISGVELADIPFHVFLMVAVSHENAELLNVRFHKHNFFELHFIISGYLGYSFDNKKLTVGEDEMILIAPNTTHRVSSVPSKFGKVTIGIEVRNGYAMQKAMKNISDKVFKCDGSLKEALCLLLKTADEKTENKAMLIQLAIHSVVYRILAKSDTEYSGEPKECKSDDRVLSAKKYINDNPNVFFTCAEVAAYCHISSKQLGRLFRAYEGAGLLEYIYQSKLNQVISMLKSTSETQTDIAKKLGFSNVQYFSKFFIRMTGQTPAKFREGSK